MTIHRAIAATISLALPLLLGSAQAADIKVFSSNALKSVIEELGPQFEKATENKLVMTWKPAAVLKSEIEQGAVFDVAVLTKGAIDDLVKQGKIAADTRATLARSGVGVAVHKGAPKPDISTTEAFKTALRNAKSIGFVGQGASGIYLKTLFEKLGIAEELKPKIKLLPTAAGAAAASGEVEIAMTQISEILPYAGAELVGPLPPEIQLYTVFAAGVAAGAKETAAGKALIKFLTAPSALPVIKAKGMEPG
jgi:molybdate transport system substrate-binding protein